MRELVAAGARLLEKPFASAELRREVSDLLRMSLHTVKMPALAV